jgi:hypothetical protein
MTSLVDLKSVAKACRSRDYGFPMDLLTFRSACQGSAAPRVRESIITPESLGLLHHVFHVDEGAAAAGTAYIASTRSATLNHDWRAS